VYVDKNLKKQKIFIDAGDNHAIWDGWLPGLSDGETTRTAMVKNIYYDDEMEEYVGEVKIAKKKVIVVKKEDIEDDWPWDIDLRRMKKKGLIESYW